MNWPLPPLADARLFHEDSVHYALDTPTGKAAWKATLPRGGAVVHLGPDARPFTVSMFHQLRCLDILRELLVDLYWDESPGAQVARPELAAHCMNYLRQTVMCRADMRLEHVRSENDSKVTVSEVTHVCKDWTAVYDAAESNYGEFLARLR